MTPNDREHSRVGPGSGFGARTGAGQLRPNEAAETTAAAGLGDGGAAATGGPTDPGMAAGDDRQRFAAEGHLTGRAIPPQPQQAPLAAAPIDPTEVEVLHAQNAELTEHLQRLAADFDNFRKRARREVIQASASASDKLLGEMLAVLDDLGRALEHANESDPAQVINGIRMVYDRLSAVLNEHGLEEIPAVGQFDPHLHEAMMMQPAPEVPEGQILQVLQKGYRIGDRVLRHAKVIVAGS